MTILQGHADPQPVPTENTPPGETRRGRGKGRVQPETSRGGRKRLREPERRRRYGEHVVGEVRPKSERPIGSGSRAEPDSTSASLKRERRSEATLPSQLEGGGVVPCLSVRPGSPWLSPGIRWFHPPPPPCAPALWVQASPHRVLPHTFAFPFPRNHVFPASVSVRAHTPRPPPHPRTRSLALLTEDALSTVEQLNCAGSAHKGTFLQEPGRRGAERRTQKLLLPRVALLAQVGDELAPTTTHPAEPPFISVPGPSTRGVLLSPRGPCVVLCKSVVWTPVRSFSIATSGSQLELGSTTRSCCLLYNKSINLDVNCI